jgi:hypothetical protein
LAASLVAFLAFLAAAFPAYLAVASLAASCLLVAFLVACLLAAFLVASLACQEVAFLYQVADGHTSQDQLMRRLEVASTRKMGLQHLELVLLVLVVPDP